MKTIEEIKQEIKVFEEDLETMKSCPAVSETHRKNAMFCQQEVINALKWTLE